MHQVYDIVRYNNNQCKSYGKSWHYEKQSQQIKQRQFKLNRSFKCSVEDKHERKKIRNLHLIEERIELRDLPMDVCREEAVKCSL